jgi:hypothetical protein
MRNFFMEILVLAIRTEVEGISLFRVTL